MDLDHCIAAHAQWKMKFRGAISARETLDAASIGRDNCCELGRWLHGEGRTLHGGKAPFTTLLARHREFHAEAGKVAQAINARQYDQASQAISNGTPYASASNEVGLAIISLKRALQA